MVINFGKHKGEDISSIPSDYLEWLIETLEDDPKFNKQKPGLFEEIEDELQTRERSYSHFYTQY